MIFSSTVLDTTRLLAPIKMMIFSNVDLWHRLIRNGRR